MVVAADSPYKTLADVVAAAKAKPRPLNYASPATAPWRTWRPSCSRRPRACKFTHVPYKGAAQARPT